MYLDNTMKGAGESSQSHLVNPAFAGHGASNKGMASVDVTNPEIVLAPSAAPRIVPTDDAILIKSQLPIGSIREGAPAETVSKTGVILGGHNDKLQLFLARLLSPSPRLTIPISCNQPWIAKQKLTTCAP